MVQANDMDLSLIQFDYDMSFAVVFLDAERNVYGRYGTRSQRPDAADSEISAEGLMASMQAALDLHGRRKAILSQLAAKKGPAPEHPTPSDFPSLSDKYDKEILYGENVARSCIHCHQIHDAERLEWRRSRRSMPDAMLFPYPMPSVLGLDFDKSTRATVADVTPASAAQKAGIRPGDELLSLEGQPIVSVADVQWVLHRAPDSGQLAAVVRSKEDNALKKLTLPLRAGWRKHSDISWRVSSWNLRRLAFGGMKLDPVTPEERTALGIGPGKLALRAAHVGQYNEHAVAMRAGALKGDVLVEFDGISSDSSETDLIAHALQQKKPGDEIRMIVLRDGAKKTLTIRLP